MIATNLTLVTNAANVAALRTQASAGFTANSVATVLLSAGNRPYYRWVAASTATDDGVSVIKPNDIGGASPGRWLLRDWVEQTTDPTYVQIVFSTSLGAAAGVSNYAFEIGQGWRLVGVEIEGTNRIGWFVKDVAA